MPVFRSKSPECSPERLDALVAALTLARNAPPGERVEDFSSTPWIFETDGVPTIIVWDRFAELPVHTQRRTVVSKVWTGNSLAPFKSSLYCATREEALEQGRLPCRVQFHGTDKAVATVPQSDEELCREAREFLSRGAALGVPYWLAYCWEFAPMIRFPDWMQAFRAAELLRRERPEWRIVEYTTE